MKKIIIIGANEFQNPLILKAKEMGFETHVFAWKDGAVGEKNADYFYPISIIEKEQILEECKKIQPDAVASIGSDLANITVQYLAEKLGLPGNSSECITNSTNKYQMRKAFKEHGLKTPQFATVSIDDDLTDIANTFKFPLIVKPTDRSGSRGIMKVNNLEELTTAVKESASYSFEKHAIVEEFITGNEYSCECISYKGEHHFLTITKKFTTGAPHYIETGHIEPSDLSDEIVENVKKTIFAALTALDVQYGASHSEFRVDEDGNIGIIEIGSRMGGDCIGSDLVPLSTGKDFVKMVIQTALGEKPDLTPAHEPRFSAIRFIFSQEDLDILENIKKNAPEALSFVSEIEDFGGHQIVDSGSRFGFYIMSCDTREQILELSKLK